MEALDSLWVWLYANWFGIFGLFIGCIPTAIVYRWQRRNKRPYYSRRSSFIISNAKDVIPDVTVHYKGHGEDLDNLSVTILALWNAGRETLSSSDFVPLKPLAVKSSAGVKILAASVIQKNTATSAASCLLKKSHNTVMIAFDFLDYNDGFVVEVFHTGTLHKDVWIEGAFKGCGDILEYDNQGYISKLNSLMLRRKQTRRSLQRGRGWLMINYGILVAIIACGSTIYDYNHKSFDVVCIEGANHGLIGDNYRIVQQSDGIVAYKPMRGPYISLFLLMSLSVFNIYIGWRLLKSGIPNTLDKFEDRFS